MINLQAMEDATKTVAQSQVLYQMVRLHTPMLLSSDSVALLSKIIKDMSLHVKQLQVEILALEQRCQARHK